MKNSKFYLLRIKLWIFLKLGKKCIFFFNSWINSVIIVDTRNRNPNEISVPVRALNILKFLPRFHYQLISITWIKSIVKVIFLSLFFFFLIKNMNHLIKENDNQVKICYIFKGLIQHKCHKIIYILKFGFNYDISVPVPVLSWYKKCELS